MEPRKQLVAYSLKYDGDWNHILKATRTHEPIEDYYLDMVDKLKCKTITLLDLDYPIQLRNVYKPPIVLYYYGDLSLAKDYRRNVSMVGSRKYSGYGAQMTEKIGGDLARKDYVIVSGLAKGIDGIAHKAAIDSGGKTIAILGSGIDCCYPMENQELYDEIKKNHLLISEYPNKVEPISYHFPVRNRIIAGISKTLVVTEASYCSGTLITAMLALQGNTDVMCVPYEAGKQSECNRLISHGAFLVESADDVIEQMSPY